MINEKLMSILNERPINKNELSDFVGNPDNMEFIRSYYGESAIQKEDGKDVVEKETVTSMMMYLIQLGSAKEYLKKLEFCAGQVGYSLDEAIQKVNRDSGMISDSRRCKCADELMDIGIEKAKNKETLTSFEIEPNPIIDKEIRKLVEHCAKYFGYEDKVQNNPHHTGTINEHVAKVVEMALKSNYEKWNGDKTDIMITAALLHDIGKFDTINVNKKTGYSQFLKHADRSVEMVEDLLSKMVAKSNKHTPWETEEVKQEYEIIKTLVKLHDTQYAKKGKCDNLWNEIGKHVYNLALLQYYDVCGQSDHQRLEKLNNILTFAQRFNNDTFMKPLYKLIEREMEQFKIRHRDEPDKSFLARTVSNQDVYIDTKTKEHMQAHPDVKMAHIVEAIGKIGDYNGAFRIGSVTLDHEEPIGTNNCVEMQKGDVVVPVYRKGREGTTLIVIGKEGAPTDQITIGICKDEDGKDTMFTAFYGPISPKELHSYGPDETLSAQEKEEKEIARKFWSEHALVFDKDIIDFEKTAIELPESIKTIEKYLQEKEGNIQENKTPIVEGEMLP